MIVPDPKYTRVRHVTMGCVSGEVLIVEPPYTATLLHDKRYRHCSHCLQRSYVLLPCRACRWVSVGTKIVPPFQNNYLYIPCFERDYIESSFHIIIIRLYIEV